LRFARITCETEARVGFILKGSDMCTALIAIQRFSESLFVGISGLAYIFRSPHSCNQSIHRLPLLIQQVMSPDALVPAPGHPLVSRFSLYRNVDLIFTTTTLFLPVHRSFTFPRLLQT
jgi:hypothetical protein